MQFCNCRKSLLEYELISFIVHTQVFEFSHDVTPTVARIVPSSSGRPGVVVKIQGSGFSTEANKNIVHFGMNLFVIISFTSNQLDKLNDQADIE